MNMFGVKKPDSRFSGHNLPAGNNKKESINTFDDDNIHNISAARRTSLGRTQVTRAQRASLFDDDSGNKTAGEYENQSVQELESFAVIKSEETTKSVNNCLKIAEEIREGAVQTLVQLHHQGKQITKTHLVATELDHDLRRGEKLLASLGGIFSKTWMKLKKTRNITGPIMTRDDSFVRRGSHLQQREKLGLNDKPKRRSQSKTPPPESADVFQRVKFEKAKQDDGLSELSDILVELKNMAVDLGKEQERQTNAFVPMEKDVDELHARVYRANRRGFRFAY